MTRLTVETEEFGVFGKYLDKNKIRQYKLPFLCYNYIKKVRCVMKYGVGRILKFSIKGWRRFKQNSTIPYDILENAVVKYIVDEDLVVVDENRLYRF